MELTGKCKEDFEKWYEPPLPADANGWDKALYGDKVAEIYRLPKSMRYGVYVDFFDSVGIYIDLEIHAEPTMSGLIFKSIRPNILSNGRFYTVGASFRERPIARTEAIKKANELYND